jgi:hypothetical protein
MQMPEMAIIVFIGWAYRGAPRFRQAGMAPLRQALPKNRSLAQAGGVNRNTLKAQKRSQDSVTIDHHLRFSYATDPRGFDP